MGGSFNTGSKTVSDSATLLADLNSNVGISHMVIMKPSTASLVLSSGDPADKGLPIFTIPTEVTEVALDDFPTNNMKIYALASSEITVTYNFW